MKTPCTTDQDEKTVEYDGTQRGRNDDCPCGSGAKYKHCCLQRHKARGDRATAAPWPAEQAEEFEFSELGGRQVRGTFTSGMVTSDGGVLVWRELEEKFGLIEAMAEYCSDFRDASLIEFSVEQLLAQRVFGLLHGYEDLLDHDCLRGDYAFGAAVGRDDPAGQDRRQDQDEGKPLCGKSTLNRFELGTEEGSPTDPYKKIIPDLEGMRTRIGELAVELMETVDDAPDQVVVDLDPADIPLYGNQQGRHYDGYYGEYCYLPIYGFVDQWPVDLRMGRSADKASKGAVQMVDQLVETILSHWGQCTVVVRGDSDFSKNLPLMSRIEQAEGVEFVFGLKRNPRLDRLSADAMSQAREESQQTGEAARRYTEFAYQTQTSWPHPRRVVAKAEYLPANSERNSPKNNHRYVVTSLASEKLGCRETYEAGYCPRGNAENHIQENQQQLFGTRSSTAFEASNHFRMLMSALAHLFVVLLREVALRGTALEGAGARTIRQRLLKVGAQVEVTVRHVWMRYSSHFPFQHLLVAVTRRIRAGPSR